MSDNADRVYGSFKTLIVPKGLSRYSQRMRRIVPDAPEIDYGAVVAWSRGGGEAYYTVTDPAEREDVDYGM